jgi:hypothetical protein
MMSRLWPILVLDILVSVLGVPSLLAVVALCWYPRLRGRCIGVLATSPLMCFVPFILGRILTLVGYYTIADDIGFVLVFFYWMGYVGWFHFGMFLILIGSVIEERKWDSQMCRVEESGDDFDENHGSHVPSGCSTSWAFYAPRRPK